METLTPAVSDMLITVKSREIQRGMFAEMRNDRAAARVHFLASAYLELVLAEDYAIAGLDELVLRSRLSAASCFWRGGEMKLARELFREITRDVPAQKRQVQQLVKELKRSSRG